MWVLGLLVFNLQVLVFKEVAEVNTLDSVEEGESDEALPVMAVPGPAD